MKQYDHEPTMMELFEQLKEEYAYIPDFLPSFMRLPIIRDVVGGPLKQAMVENVIDMMLV